jgi:hypothetical protein
MKKKRKKPNTLKQIMHSLLMRDHALDGRFRTRVVKNKKKALNKRMCRKKVESDE